MLYSIPAKLIGYKKIRRTAFQEIIDVRAGYLTKEKYQGAINEYAKARSPKTVVSAHALFNRVFKENHMNIVYSIDEFTRLHYLAAYNEQRT